MAADMFSSCVSVFPTVGNSWNNPCDGRDCIASNEGKFLTEKKAQTHVASSLPPHSLELKLGCPECYGGSRRDCELSGG